MTKSDQEEYLKLHNQYERNFRLNSEFQSLKRIIMKMEADAVKAENILNILEHLFIYLRFLFHGIEINQGVIQKLRIF